MAIGPVIGRRAEMVIPSAEWVTSQSIGFDPIILEKNEIEGHWVEERLLVGFTIDVNKGGYRFRVRSQRSRKG